VAPERRFRQKVWQSRQADTLAEKRSNSAANSRAYCRLSPPESRFRQNVWESGTQSRVPIYVWVSRACRGGEWAVRIFEDGERGASSPRKIDDAQRHTDELAAVARRKIMRNARSRKKRFKLMAELERRCQDGL